MVDLFGRLATRVRRTAGLTFAAGGLHVVVLVGQWLNVCIAIAKDGHRGNPAREDADWVEGALEGKLVVGDFVRVAPPPARLDTDQVPATAPLLVRLRHSEVVLALVAAQFLRILFFVAAHGNREDRTDDEQEQQHSPGKSNRSTQDVNGHVKGYRRLIESMVVLCLSTYSWRMPILRRGTVSSGCF